MKTSELEDLVNDANERIINAHAIWYLKAFNDVWDDDTTVETLVENFIEKLRAAVGHA